jgi:hypothetical protein
MAPQTPPGTDDFIMETCVFMDFERKTLGSRRFNREKNVTVLYFTRYQDIGPQGDLDRENMGKPGI